MTQISTEYLKYAADVAEALKDVASRKASYGEFYVLKVSFGFEGEDDNQLAIVPDEFGGLSIEVNHE